MGSTLPGNTSAFQNMSRFSRILTEKSKSDQIPWDPSRSISLFFENLIVNVYMIYISSSFLVLYVYVYVYVVVIRMCTCRRKLF